MRYLNTVLLIGTTIRVDPDYADPERIIPVGIHKSFPPVPDNAVLEDITLSAYPINQMDWSDPVAKRAIKVSVP